MNLVFVLVLLCLAGLAGLFGYVHSLGVEEALQLTLESGPIEWSSALGYFVCAVLLVAWGKKAFVHSHYYILVVLCVLGMRELDFDKRFTTEGVFKSKFLFSSHVPLIEKIIGGLVLLVIIVCLFKLAKRHLIPFFKGLLSFQPTDVAIAAGMALMVVSKTIDGAARKLKPLGIKLSEETVDVLSYAEEVMELGIPIMFIIAAYSYFKSKRAL